MSSLSVYNTLTRQKEIFVPIDPNNVRMYVCGPTVYDFAHIGNARPVVVFDILYRLLKRHYKRVTYVRNITDVDDKIIQRSKETNESINKITTRTTQAYHEDMAALNALSPDQEPRCTDHIPQMTELITDLLAKGHAYVADSHVLFSVPSMSDYGQLSRRSRDELVAGARVEVAPYKKDAADFILWKPSAPDQPGWESPWGRGRPGWHIECSAMAKKHLGITFDIHGGGLDLIFPHHENEIAQSRSAHDGKHLANYWMHNGFLTINNDKMSKSLGNFFTVRELLKQYQGEVIRLVLLNAHYRQPLDFSSKALDDAKATLDRWYGALRSTAALQSEKVSPSSRFENTLLDDLNTPLAIAQIHELVGDLNRADASEEKASIRSQLLAVGDCLGFLQQDPELWFKGLEQNNQGLSDRDIVEKINDRLKARQSKNFAEADRLRNMLASKGIILEDGPQGTSWRRS